MSRTSVVFITVDPSSGAHRVHGPGNVPGVDIAHAKGVNREVFWVFHNQTDNDVTVKMAFASQLFDAAFKSTDPVAAVIGNSKTIVVRVPRKNTGQVKGVTKKPAIGGWDLTFDLDVQGSRVDPGLRIDDGRALTFAFAAVIFTLGLVVGAVAL